MRILFIIPSFANGGTLSSLKNLLPVLYNCHFQLYLYAITNSGPNKGYVRKYCTIIGEKGVNNNETYSSSSNMSFVKRVKRLLCKVNVDISPILFRLQARLIDNGYDYVVAYQEGQPTLLASFFSKSQRIAWIHCDYKNYLNLSHRSPEIDLYNKFDKVVCVSNYTKKQFLSTMNSLKAQVYSIHNILDSETIISLSNDLSQDELPYDRKEFNILSIGRLDPVKRFDMIPKIVNQMKTMGAVGFKWYLIGDGIERDRIEQIVANEANCEVVLLGEINNPYPYLVHADLFVSLSESEACPYVINEAKVLHVPIVSTDFGSVYEFLGHGEKGIISSIHSISNEIARMIMDKEYYSTTKKAASDFEYDNTDIIQTIVNDVFN